MTTPRFLTLASALLAVGIGGTLVAGRAGTAHGQARLRAHVDPATGRLTGAPAGAGAGAAAVAEPGEAPEEVAGTSAAGGVRVRLPERFRTTLRAHLGADGRVIARCEH